MKIAFFGTADFSSSILKQLIAFPDVSVEFVVSQEDKLVGRKKEIQKTAVKKVAEENNIRVLQPPRLSTDSSIHSISQEIDFFVVVAYGKIIPESILSIPHHGSINLHGSVLPLYRGASPVQESIKNGDMSTGLTTMYMSKGMDEGDILLVQGVDIDKGDTQRDVFEKFKEVGAQLIYDTLVGIQKNDIQAIPQDSIDASYCKKISKHDGIIDFATMTSQEIYNLYRAYYGWPGIHVFYNGKKVDIMQCAVHDELRSEKVGTVVKISKREYGVVCSDKKILLIQALKLEGKKTMNILDFVNGNRDFIGYKF